MEKEYIVIVNKGVDLEQFDSELAASTGNDKIPNRSVDVANPRPGSKRMTHWMLTDDEANNLKKDPRVLNVEIPPKMRTDISIGLNATQEFNFNKITEANNTTANWGLTRVNSTSNNYGNGSTPLRQEFEYAIDGTGVDIVIQDTGIEAGHPEFNNKKGISRLQQIDWYSASGLPGTMPTNHYTDYHGHGTHCAGVSAGLTYGFAKNANIYALKVEGLEGPTDPNVGIPVEDCFDVIKQWHQNKNNGRPTVVNMSWGYGGTRLQTNPTSGVYRGNPWVYALETGLEIWQQYGVVPLLSGNTPARRIPVRVASVDTDIEELIDAGVHVCIAAGNSYYKIDVSTGDDYNNTVDLGNGQEFYHRGSSPYSDRAFMVGNINSSTIENESGIFIDRTAESSNRGPGTNIWAPGTDILSSNSNVTVLSPVANYDDNYTVANISGTSMASPQVAGVVALHAQIKPNITPEQMQTRIFGDSKPTIYNPGTDTDYDEYFTHILGSENRFLYNRYGRQPLEINSPSTVTIGSV